MRIQELRKERGMSQLELAARLGVGQPTVSNWESGYAVPRTQQLPDIARVLQVSIDRLFDEADETH